MKEYILVDKDKWGVNDNTDYNIAPEYYYDIRYNCVGCGIPSVWTAERQKYFFEELGSHINSRAVRCKICSAHVEALKEDQQRHMVKMAEKKTHKNEAFFKRKY